MNGERGDAVGRGAAETQPRSEKSVNKTLSFMGVMQDCNPVMIDVEEDKVVRIRPFHYDSKQSA